MLTLVIQDLFATAGEKEILKGLNLKINEGEVHAIMGPNGSGKSTLSKVIMGHPNYTVTKGKILLNGKNIVSLSPDERAKKGLFLGFQSPQKIPGLHTSQFLRSAVNNKHRGKSISVFDFRTLLEKEREQLAISPQLTDRYLNEGFSGGEMKKTEVLQMTLLQPKIAILDEIDSGLDIDALQIVCKNINALLTKTGMGLLLITHYNRILDYIKPDKLHIMTDGSIIRSGPASLAKEIEKKGYCILCQEVRSHKKNKLPVLSPKK
jgi:Fe-S cluster assembly ATP-binding protein